MLEVLGGLVLNSPFWTIFILLLILFVTYEYRKRIDLPPGPYGVPFFGYAFFLDRTRMSAQLNELCKKYRTDILSVAFVGPPLIVLNTYELIKECFVKRTDLVDRQDIGFFTAFDSDYTGVISTSGTKWREARRFSISKLRDFGMGRVGAEESIRNEGHYLCDAINLRQGEAFDPRDLINIAVSNVICGMVFGQRFDSNNEEFIGALEGMNGLISKLNNIALFIALKRKFLRENLFHKKYNDVLNEYNKMKTFVMNQIEEHKQNYNGEVTDLIYGYLKDAEEGNHEDVFDDNMLKSLIIDYFFAGSETTYTTLRWCLLALAANPDMQAKIQRELDTVVGQRDVSMNDRKSTPYTEAFLCEAMRHFTLIPGGVGHCNNSESVIINGYTIPPKCIIVGNVRWIHHDPQHWKNPDEFDPENFLEDGVLDHTDKLIPFGIGRRSCAGESLARMELYIFFTCLVKRFNIRLETDDTKADLEGVHSAVYQPKPFKLRMAARN